MRGLISGLIVAVCISLAPGPVLAQQGKADHKKHKKHKKIKKAKQPKPSTFFGQKGTWTLGGVGALRVDWQKADEADDWMGPVTLSVAPMVGYFVIEGLELRVGPEFTYMNTPSVYILAGGARFGGLYHHKIQGTLFLSAGAGVGLAGGKTKVENTNISTNDFLWKIGPRLGITLAFGGKYGGFIQLLGFFDYGGIERTSSIGSVESDATLNMMNFGVQTGLGIFF